VLAVRWYLRYGLSYRDLEQLLAERGIDVDHVSVFRWVKRCPRIWSAGCVRSRDGQGRAPLAVRGQGSGVA
jgi:transposase, IS6 family